MSFWPAPGKHQLNHRERSRTQRESRRISVAQMAESQIATRERNPPLVNHQLQPKRSPDRVLKAFLQQQKIRRPIPVILITGKRHRAIDVLPSERLLKIKRHRAGYRVDRLRKQESR